VLRNRRNSKVIDQRIDKRVEMSGVHTDTGFHRRCPTGTISQYGPHSPGGPSNLSATGVAV
jgi:hypothetical protein